MADLTVSTPVDTFMQAANQGAMCAALSNGGTAVTAGQVFYAGTAGILQGSANLTFTDGTTTGQLVIPVGAVATPSITFLGDTNTGIFRVAADTMGISAGGVDSAWFTATAWQGLNTLTGGIQLYNTSDKTTNYERVSFKWSSNVGLILAEKGGSGTLRNLAFNSGVANYALSNAGNVAGDTTAFHSLSVGGTSLTGKTYWSFLDSAGNTATSGTSVGAAIRITYNQASGNAANTDLKIARTETALGSGIQNFIQCLAGAAGTTEKFTVLNTGITSFYAGVATAGWGSPAIYGSGSIAATTNARSAAVATYTVGAADGTFVVSGNVNITTSTTHSFSLDCVYTDETNASRTLVIPMAQLAGSFVATGLITNVTGAGPYESASMTIRCKASTSITIRPSAGGTYTAVVYNTAASIMQIA